MDKSTEAETNGPAAPKPMKNGNGKDKGNNSNNNNNKAQPNASEPKQQDQQQSGQSPAAAVAAPAAPPKQVPKNKKRKAKDVNAPKHPLTGYVRYMNEFRETIRSKNPTLPAMEITKLLAEDWSALSEDAKKPYLDAAEADRERYNREISEYKLNNPDAMIRKRPKAAATAAPSNGDDSDSTPAAPKDVPYLNGKEEKRELRVGDYEIPIFTDDFLEHNKIIDSELRMLRKSNIDYEQQNSVLEKHVENMDNGIQKLENETNSLKSRNVTLQNYLQRLRTVLAGALSGLPIGSEVKGATVDNIDRYMGELHQMVKSNTHGHVLNKAKDIIRKLDLNSLAT
ncbi:high mobility group protein 20A [Uranotaenia lowii]|uniref:high mobility group protein 20A n=1 Tax=Uranotaenia lowii TaxID=190385 RepID=UPI002479CE26|nr:high mobility group protein 20A [Uranotaenia lowii]